MEENEKAEGKPEVAPKAEAIRQFDSRAEDPADIECRELMVALTVLLRKIESSPVGSANRTIALRHIEDAISRLILDRDQPWKRNANQVVHRPLRQPTTPPSFA